MDLNITLFGQMLTFGVLVWVIYRYLLPKFQALLGERQREISDGLMLAKKSREQMEAAKLAAKQLLIETQQQAEAYKRLAKNRAQEVIASARQEALELQRQNLVVMKQHNEALLAAERKVLLKEQHEQIVLAIGQILGENWQKEPGWQQAIVARAVRQI